MTHAEVTLAIPTCVNPSGLHNLLESISTSQDQPGKTVIFFDGNPDWRRLDQMDEYRQRFSEADCARIQAANVRQPDYSFLQDRFDVVILRGQPNRGPVGAFNACYRAAYMAGFAVLANDDTEVSGNWIAGLLTVMRERPRCVVTAYSNIRRNDPRPKVIQSGPVNCTYGALSMVRGTYLRELINQRGWVDDPKFQIFKTDTQRVCEPAGRGHDAVFVGDPFPVTHKHYQSLGDWVAEKAKHDAPLEISYPVNNGAAGRMDTAGRTLFVRVNGSGHISEETE